MGRKNKSNG